MICCPRKTAQLSDLSRELDQHGYALVRELNPKRSTIDVAEDIGTVIDPDMLLPGRGFSAVQRLTPRKASEARKNGYSSEFGLGEFPLHTDLAHWAVPPRYLMLRCVQGTKNVTTRLLPASDFEDTVGFAAVQQALFRPRRASRPRAMGLLPLVFTSNFCTGLRWDSQFLKPVNSAAKAVAACVASLSGQWKCRTEVSLSCHGDTLIVDNWRMLHGRSVIDENANRIVDRVYFSEITP